MDAKQIITDLSRPFDKRLIKNRKIGGRQVDYVGGESYIAALNAATPEWSFRVTKEEVRVLTVMRWNDASRKREPAEVPCQLVHAELEIPGVGTRAGIGVQLLEDGAGEDVVKGALTDAFKNCCKYFGLGLHLYTDGNAPLLYEDAPVERSTGPSGDKAGDQVSDEGSDDIPDYSARDDWKQANAKLHAVATNVIGKDHAHDAIKTMTQRTKGVDSHKHLDATALQKMAAFIESDAFDAYYRREVAPYLPQPEQQEMN